MEYIETIQIGPYKGWIFEDLPEEIRDFFPFWLVAKHVEGGEKIVPGRVYRWNDYIVKFFGPRSPFLPHFIHSPAWRTVRAYCNLKPILSPAPIALFEQVHPFRAKESTIILKYIKGLTLEQIWNKDEYAMGQLPVFFAEMHKRKIIHGDLSVNNILWTGNEWALIDLDSIGMRNFRFFLFLISYKHYILLRWKRIYCSLHLDNGLQDIFYKYMEKVGLTKDRDTMWHIIDQNARKTYKRAKIKSPI